MRNWRTRATRFLIVLSFILPLFSIQANAAPVAKNQLTVQLNWYAQSQFAGFYVARELGFFSKRDLDVSLLQGSVGKNPIDSLFDGSADVAQASMAQAITSSREGQKAVNIAQLFQDSDTALICLESAFMKSQNDLLKAKIAVSKDLESTVSAILRSVGGSETRKVEFVTPLPDIENLLNGSADCIWGSEFNEYWKAKEAGLPIFVVRPKDQDVRNIQDGLYVDASRMSDANLRKQLVSLFIGLRQGWEQAKSSPASSVQLVLQENLTLDYISQRRQLELVLALITDHFGYFDPAKYESPDSLGLLTPVAELEGKLWTHRIYDEVAKIDGQSSIASRAIRDQLERTRGTWWYQGLIWIAIFAYAVSASIIGLKMGYRLWGQIVLAGLIALGGGVIRDLLVARQRSPLPLTIDPVDLYAILAGVLFTAWVAKISRNERILHQLDAVAKWADAFGFAILSVNGAAIATVANLPLVWVPICAALTVAGGGVLLDVVIRREHIQFRHEIYEEIAIIGSLLLAGAFALASRIEQHIMVPVIFISMSLILTYVRYLIVSRNIHYPNRRVGVAGLLYEDSMKN